MRVAGAIYEALYSVKFAGKTARKGIARWLIELSSLCNALSKRAQVPLPPKEAKDDFPGCLPVLWTGNLLALQ